MATVWSWEGQAGNKPALFNPVVCCMAQASPPPCIEGLAMKEDMLHVKGSTTCTALVATILKQSAGMVPYRAWLPGQQSGHLFAGLLLDVSHQAWM